MMTHRHKPSMHETFASQPSRRPSRQDAFTLIESIGVLVVIAGLVAVTAPSVIRKVDRAAWERETAELQTIADSYTQYVLRSNTIPGLSTWATNVASQISTPVSAITTNSRRYARAFLIDTDLNINGTGLPYTQTPNGTTKPVSARVMIVSSLSRALPISSSVPASTEFKAIWDTAEGAKPSTWTNWAGSGDDLRIKRLNLEPLFEQLILVNRDPTNTARFSIDGALLPLPPDGIWNQYYLDGTVLGLHRPNDEVVSRHLLRRNISFVFDSGGWPDLLPSNPAYSGNGAAFVNHAITFLGAVRNPYPTAAGASQSSVILAMYTFMFDYALWANECPHFDDHGNGGSPASIPEYIMLDNQGQNNGNIDRFSLALIAKK